MNQMPAITRNKKATADAADSNLTIGHTPIIYDVYLFYQRSML